MKPGPAQLPSFARSRSAVKSAQRSRSSSDAQAIHPAVDALGNTREEGLTTARSVPEVGSVSRQYRPWIPWVKTRDLSRDEPQEGRLFMRCRSN